MYASLDLKSARSGRSGFGDFMSNHGKSGASVCIPEEEYYKLGASKAQLVRYNGIDEIAWISEYQPDPSVLDMLDLEKGQYSLMRTEMTHTQYLRETMKPEETAIPDFLPSIVRAFPNHKFFLLVRSPLQEEYLKKKLHELDEKHVIITRYVPHLQDMIFYSSFIASGGGTIVRESSLMDVPSLEFFPGDTAWQEDYLVREGFPMYHIKHPRDIAAKAIDILSKGPGAGRFTGDFKSKLEKYDNPARICFEHIIEELDEAH